MDANENWAPERIFLQRGQVEGGEHTWCEDSVGNDEIEEATYVRHELYVQAVQGRADMRQALRNARAALPSDASQAPMVPQAVIDALRFYAHGHHYNIDDDHQQFDTVSGEPQNWLMSERDDDCTMIEDGSIAKAALCGGIQGFEEPMEPIEGEVLTAVHVALISADECAQDVYKHGKSIGLFDIPKETANAICAGIAAVTGARVDWHYIAGRVHMKAIAAAAGAPAAAAPTPQQISDYLHSLDAIQREVVEREARAAAPSEPQRFDAVELILRDVCENEPADPEQNDTVCIDISDLKIILDRHIASTNVPANCFLEWAVGRWNAEVACRPLVNVHRPSLDGTWRQVIRYLGGDDISLLGPRHSELLASTPTPTVAADAAALSDELASMKRMFHAACADLGAINQALGLDPEDGGAEPILDAIAELKRERDQWVDENYAAPGQPDERAAFEAKIESAIEESDGHWHEDEFRINGKDLKNLCNAIAILARATAPQATVKGDERAAPVEENSPVAWEISYDGGITHQFVKRDDVADENADRLRRNGYIDVQVRPLYAVPASGSAALTTEQIDAIREQFHPKEMPSRGLVQRINKLARAAVPQAGATQQPVATIHRDGSTFHTQWHREMPELFKLDVYAAAQAGATLTDEQILDNFEGRAMVLRDECGTPTLDGARVIEGVRALLADNTAEKTSWSKEPPAEQGLYWHWTGDLDACPIPLNVLYSGATGKCFVAIGQYGILQAIDCDKYGGYWQLAVEPAMDADIGFHGSEA